MSPALLLCIGAAAFAAAGVEISGSDAGTIIASPNMPDVGPFVVDGRVAGAAVKSRRHARSLNTRQRVALHGNTGWLRRTVTRTDAGASIQLEITGKGPAWSAPVELRVTWRPDAPVRMWLPWTAPPGATGPWTDPLELRPVTECTYYYGAPPFTWREPRVGFVPMRNDLICMPLLVLAGAEGALTFAQPPDDTILDLTISVRPGEAVFRWDHHRFSKQPLAIHMNVTAHEADWRPALAWMAARYPDYVEPPDPGAHRIAGCGAYSTYENMPDARRFCKMAFRVNWKASYDFPYMGMFIPPVGDDERYPRFMPPPDRQTTSVGQMADYAARMRMYGFHVLSYFNVTEFGANIEGPEAVDPDLGPDAQWKNPHNMLFRAMPGAALRKPGGGFWRTWGGAIATDCGDPAYRDFLLKQARAHVTRFPSSDGICIDRLDWLRFPNPHADDGVSMLDGQPCRLLYRSWHGLMEDLSPILHDAGKYIFVNNHLKRIDLLRHVDGLYCEFSQNGAALNATGLLCLAKPAIGWTASPMDLQPDGHALFQRHLHMGVYPTAPFPENDHTINPDAWADAFYLAYGPLFEAIRGKRWVLTPHAVAVVSGPARANLFETPEGYVIPVTGGGDSKEATVRLRGLTRPPGQIHWMAQVLHPGRREFERLGLFKCSDDPLDIAVPLIDGCALLRLPHKEILPHQLWFGDTVRVTMNAWADAEMRYTTDGTMPTAESPLYNPTKPLTLAYTTTVTMALFRNGAMFGRPCVRTYVQTQHSPPEILPAKQDFQDRVTVTIEPIRDGDFGTVRYALDGREPTEQSPAYSGPFTLTESAPVLAAFFPQSGRRGMVARAHYMKIPPTPPLPDVYIDMLPFLRASLDWGDRPRINKSIQDNPLRVAGNTYARGLGVHAKSEVVYPMRPEYDRFVATAGVDDEMAAYPFASIVFAVYADAELLAQSPVLNPGGLWHFDVPLPPDAHEIRLVVGDANNGVTADHGDWINAGFVRR